MKDLEQLVRYLDGELNETEKQQLIERLKTDPSLCENLDIIKDVDQLVGDKHLASFEECLREVESVNGQTNGNAATSSSTPRKMVVIRAAAIVTVILSLAVFFIYRHASSAKNYNEIYTSFYKKMPADFATRSAEMPDDDLIIAINLYNENKYKEAISAFDKIIKIDPTNNAAKLFLGICYTETNQYGNAARQFKNIMEQKDAIFEEHATWYLSLCYVKSHSPELAKQLLNKLVVSRSFYMVKASELLKQLP